MRSCTREENPGENQEEINHTWYSRAAFPRPPSISRSCAAWRMRSADSVGGTAGSVRAYENVEDRLHITVSVTASLRIWSQRERERQRETERQRGERKRKERPFVHMIAKEYIKMAQESMA